MFARCGESGGFRFLPEFAVVCSAIRPTAGSVGLFGPVLDLSAGAPPRDGVSDIAGNENSERREPSATWPAAPKRPTNGRSPLDGHRTRD